MNEYESKVPDRDVPVVRGHYSQLITLPNGSYHMAGQKAWDPNTGVLITGNMEAQVKRIFDNIALILHSKGLGIGSVSRISCHLANIFDYDEFNRWYTYCLGNHKPTRIVLGGYQLRDGALVEMCAEGHIDLADGDI